MSILEKLLSGRFLLTIITGFTFAWLAIHGILPPDKVFDVIFIVFALYFSKNRNEKPNV